MRLLTSWAASLDCSCKIDSAARLLTEHCLCWSHLSRLGQFLSQLTKMAEEFNTAVLITNQVSNWQRQSVIRLTIISSHK